MHVAQHDRSEPTALVREIIDRTRRLRPHAAKGIRDRLLPFKGMRGLRSIGPLDFVARADTFPEHSWCSNMETAAWRKAANQPRSTAG
jgi:hypothetical protein